MVTSATGTGAIMQQEYITKAGHVSWMEDYRLTKDSTNWPLSDRTKTQKNAETPATH